MTVIACIFKVIIETDIMLVPHMIYCVFGAVINTCIIKLISLCDILRNKRCSIQDVHSQIYNSNV